MSNFAINDNRNADCPPREGSAPAGAVSQLEPNCHRLPLTNDHIAMQRQGSGNVVSDWCTVEVNGEVVELVKWIGNVVRIGYD